MRITVNKNTVPNEQRSPFVTSGIRIGTPAVTVRGLGTADMKTIATCIKKVADNFEKNAPEVRQSVADLCAKYPLYE